MSIKTVIAIAGLTLGMIAFGNQASAQVVVTSGYTYSPGVVTTSYYTPASTWSYYSSPAYYATPYVSGYSATPYYSSGYYTSPYVYGSYYPAYGYGYAGWRGRRWWQ